MLVGDRLYEDVKGCREVGRVVAVRESPRQRAEREAQEWIEGAVALRPEAAGAGWHLRTGNLLVTGVLPTPEYKQRWLEVMQGQFVLDAVMRPGGPLRAEADRIAATANGARDVLYARTESMLGRLRMVGDFAWEMGGMAALGEMMTAEAATMVRELGAVRDVGNRLVRLAGDERLQDAGVELAGIAGGEWDDLMRRYPGTIVGLNNAAVWQLFVPLEPFRLKDSFSGNVLEGISFKGVVLRLMVGGSVEAGLGEVLREHNGYWHPHVRGGGGGGFASLCLGEVRDAVYSAIRAGRYHQAVELVEAVLKTYNSGSPYVTIGNLVGAGRGRQAAAAVRCIRCGTVAVNPAEHVNGLCTQCQAVCAGCGAVVRIEATGQCGGEECVQETCPECDGWYCEACGEVWCGDHVTACNCGESICPDGCQSVVCGGCEASGCTNCMSTYECESCGEECCDECIGTCRGCHRSACSSCMSACGGCGAARCSSCRVECADCGCEVCNNCSRWCSSCEETICTECYDGDDTCNRCQVAQDSVADGDNS